MVDPVVKRVRATVTQLMTVAANNKGDKVGRMSFVLYGIVDELIEELSDMPPDKLESYFVLMGSMMTWIGTGDINVLPKQLRAFAAQILGEPLPSDTENQTDTEDVQDEADARPVLALPAGSVPE